MKYTDQLNRDIEINSIPQRIISLVPSQTELLYDLGLQNEVIGITKFCVHPEAWYRNKTRVGGTKSLDLSKISSLHPDLIIGNKEENEKQQIEALMSQFSVWMSDIKNLEDALQMIASLGQIVNRVDQASQLIFQIQASFQALKYEKEVSCAYFIWKNPYLCAGSDTFIDSMMQVCGFKNVFSQEGRYPEISIQRLKEAQPELILLSSEPYPFKSTDITDLQQVLPHTKIELVDGELFSWYGSRLLKSAAYFTNLLKKL